MNQFLSATRSGRAIAALATAEGRVSSWSVEPLRKLAEFDTIFGGVLGKLAIGSASGRSVVVAAAFWRGAVSGYDADAGDLIWERRDTREVRHLAAVSEGRHIAAAFGRGPMQVLDVRSGQTVATGRGVRATYGGSDPALAIAAFDGRVALAQVNPWQELTRLDVAGSGVLDGEFAADAVLVSAVLDRDVGPSAVYAFSRSGDIRWRHEARHGWNVPWLGRDRRSRQWLGIEHDPDQHDPPALIRWSDDGAIVTTTPLPEAADYAFLMDGSHLVTAAGLIIETAKAEVVGRLGSA